MWSTAEASAALIKDKKESEIHNKYVPYETCLWDKQKHVGTEKHIKHLHNQLKPELMKFPYSMISKDHFLGYFGQMKNLNTVFGLSTMKNRLFEAVIIV